MTPVPADPTPAPDDPRAVFARLRALAHVPYGPEHLTHDEADARYLAEAARRVEQGALNTGSNLTRTVAALLRGIVPALAAVDAAAPGPTPAETEHPDRAGYDDADDLRAVLHRVASRIVGEENPLADAFADAAAEAIVETPNGYALAPAQVGTAGDAVAAGWIVALSRWIDEHAVNAGRDPEALTWHRVAKVAEEAGEVVEAMIGYSGGNPRKGRSHQADSVVAELLDTAIAALGAVEHLTGHRGSSLALLSQKVADVALRAGLAEREREARAQAPTPDAGDVDEDEARRAAVAVTDFFDQQRVAGATITAQWVRDHADDIYAVAAAARRAGGAR